MLSFITRCFNTTSQRIPRQGSQQSYSTNEVKSNEKKYFKLISWNIDGLDKLQETLRERTSSVINVIKQEEPDAIFFQEVIPKSLDLLKTHLDDYDFYTGNHKNYFVSIFTRRETLKVKKHQIFSYPETIMSRNLLIVHALYNNSIEIDLMTSHLESGETFVNERIPQLKFCFEKMINAPKNRIVLFGGDLNIHNNELQQIGDIPDNINDLWMVMSKNEKWAYTWDTQSNTNLNFSRDCFLPRYRFDRIYVRSAKATSRFHFKPISFKLQGLEMIPSIHRFCSDHWAIQVEFEL
ncbi:hypothetical protein I4U23_031360 [Adineta vaga]|nr:hypothetical protein I4U23_031360 [Adineta vaga]